MEFRQIETGSLWSIQLDSVQMSTYWDESREEAFASTLVSKEELEAAFERFEGRFSLRERLDAMTPMGGDGYVSPKGEEEKELGKLKKSVAGDQFHNFEPSLKARTYTDSKKLQLSTPVGFYELLNLWACAEGRDVSSVAAVALEAGLRSLMADGAIPKIALEGYEERSRQRVAKAEARGAITDFIGKVIGF